MTHKFVIELTDTVKGYEDSVDYFERIYGAEEITDNEIYNQALEDFYNGLADELLWIRERFGDDVYMEVRCSVGCLQNKLTK